MSQSIESQQSTKFNNLSKIKKQIQQQIIINVRVKLIMRNFAPYFKD